MEGDDLGIFLGRNTTRTLRILAKMDAAAFAELKRVISFLLNITQKQQVESTAR